MRIVGTSYTDVPPGPCLSVDRLSRLTGLGARGDEGKLNVNTARDVPRVGSHAYIKHTKCKKYVSFCFIVFDPFFLIVGKKDITQLMRKQWRKMAIVIPGFSEKDNFVHKRI